MTTRIDIKENGMPKPIHGVVRDATPEEEAAWKKAEEEKTAERGENVPAELQPAFDTFSRYFMSPQPFLVRRAKAMDLATAILDYPEARRLEVLTWSLCRLASQWRRTPR